MFMKHLSYDKKSEIKLFAGDFKQSSKEITHMDLNKFSYWEDIWKLKFNVEKKDYTLDPKISKLNVN